MVGDDKRLDGLAGITTAGRDGIVPLVRIGKVVPRNPANQGLRPVTIC